MPGEGGGVYREFRAGCKGMGGGGGAWACQIFHFHICWSRGWQGGHQGSALSARRGTQFSAPKLPRPWEASGWCMWLTDVALALPGQFLPHTSSPLLSECVPPPVCAAGRLLRHQQDGHERQGTVPLVLHSVYRTYCMYCVPLILPEAPPGFPPCMTPTPHTHSPHRAGAGGVPLVLPAAQRLGPAEGL